MAKRNHDKLPKALQPFSRVLGIHDALPDGFRPPDDTPLRDILPGVWPTVADLRALVEWGSLRKEATTKKARRAALSEGRDNG